MKMFLATLLIVTFFPMAAHSKLQVFTTEDAARYVLTNADVLALAKKSSGAHTFVGLTVEPSDRHEFDVILEFEKVDFRCFVNVSLTSRPEVVVLPSGGRITLNKLTVLSVNTERCIN